MRRWLLVLSLFAAGTARAHVGTRVSLARFLSPPPILSRIDDLGLGLVEPPTADASFTVAWDDGDADPTGRYFFYYLDHAPPQILKTDDAKALGKPIPEGAAGIWASCYCVPGTGYECPDAGDRDCRNDFTWDTSQVAEGTYWILAVDNDPPYYLYSVSESPVRISHGRAPPPAGVFLQPNGIGYGDASFTLQWIGVGTAPLTFDLAYGPNQYPGVLDPPVTIGKAVAATTNADGTFGFVWDTSALPEGDIFVELRVTDGMGRTAYTDSVPFTIFHGGGGAAPDLHAPADLAVARPPPRGGCEVGADGGTSAAVAVALGLLLAALAYARARAR
jgi:hypothetical protein